jgi:EpsI family protein
MAPVNFYVAYYASQRKGVAIHSPRTCIPGGGWSISKLGHLTVKDVNSANGDPLHVNRAIISKGEDRQLVYYWFEQRGRNLTNEYLVKWYIFWDALTRNRTDGALVRLVTPMVRTESEAAADQRLQTLLRGLYPRIAKYLPE